MDPVFVLESTRKVQRKAKRLEEVEEELERWRAV